MIPWLSSSLLVLQHTVGDLSQAVSLLHSLRRCSLYVSLVTRSGSFDAVRPTGTYFSSGIRPMDILDGFLSISLVLDFSVRNTLDASRKG
jgi:hypothetical protein